MNKQHVDSMFLLNSNNVETFICFDSPNKNSFTMDNIIDNNKNILIEKESNNSTKCDITISNCNFQNCTIIVMDKINIKIKITNSIIGKLCIYSKHQIQEIVLQRCIFREFNIHSKSNRINSFIVDTSNIYHLFISTFLNEKIREIRYNLECGKPVEIKNIYICEESIITSFYPHNQGKVENKFITYNTQIKFNKNIKTIYINNFKNIIKDNKVQFTSKGMIVYKVFKKFYKPPMEWKITRNSVLHHIIDNGDLTCSFGINVATKEWIAENVIERECTTVWVCLIPFEYFVNLVFPSADDEKFRTPYLKLLYEIPFLDLKEHTYKEKIEK